MTADNANRTWSPSVSRMLSGNRICAYATCRSRPASVIRQFVAGLLAIEIEDDPFAILEDHVHFSLRMLLPQGKGRVQATSLPLHMMPTRSQIASTSRHVVRRQQDSAAVLHVAAEERDGRRRKNECRDWRSARRGRGAAADGTSAGQQATSFACPSSSR